MNSVTLSIDYNNILDTFFVLIITKHVIFTMIRIIHDYILLYSLHAHKKRYSNLIFLYSSFSFLLFKFKDINFLFRMYVENVEKLYKNIFSKLVTTRCLVHLYPV